MENQEQRVIITVVGKDKIGLVAGVSAVLAEQAVNILDNRQTLMQDFFTMIILGQQTAAEPSLSALQAALKATGEQLGVQITCQHEDIFDYMHRI